MRYLNPLVLSFLLFLPSVFSQDAQIPLSTEDTPRQKHDYQSDVARMRKIVINSLYSHKEIFLRELISNANDAIEKLRILSLTDKSIYDGVDPLNITIKAVKDEDGKAGHIIITDTGIGMSPEELTTNLGTLAKSGTSEFLAKAEEGDAAANGNLIGAFGLGFYSSFLVADKVNVASLPPATEENPNPRQYVFSSSADDSSFEIFPDPRGNTLGRGTEITLFLRDSESEYLDVGTLTGLVNKHSSFSSAFPIYLFTQREEEVPDEDASESTETESEPKEDETAPESAEPSEEVDSDQATVEDVPEDFEKAEEKPPKTKTIIVDEWTQLNAQPPIWARDPKNVTDEEYHLFYNAFFKDFSKPLAWHHFSGDSGSGVSFKAIIYLPSKIDEAYWQQPLATRSKDVKLLVKRVFITNDLGDHELPKWANWVKVVIDAEDLPLNVSRETLQSNKFLKQLKGIILKRLIQLITRISEEDGEKFEELQKTYGTVLKLGAVEDNKNRDKLTSLVRFTTNQRNFTSLDQYVENKKKGQKQIFYLAELGKEPEEIAKSVFVEKLHARGYEVLLLNEPLDEIMVQNLRRYKNMPFQDIAKVGLKFGDEDLDEEEEKELQKELTEKYQPLLTYLKTEAIDLVRDVIISNRLVASPCAVVADTYGYTANVQKMMSASNAKNGRGPMYEFAKKARVLEINPKSPLIEGLLRRVESLPAEEEERDPDVVAELKEVTSILVDGALIRSGFEVPNTNDFFIRVDKVLRRSLGVSETAPTDTTVKPAPPVDPEELPEEEQPVLVDPAEEAGNNLQFDMEEIDDEGNVVKVLEKEEVAHDEL